MRDVAAKKGTPRIDVKIIPKYILKELAGPTLLGVIVFTFLFLLREVFDMIELLVRRGVGLELIAGLFSSLLPMLLSLTVPMALLVGTLICFGRLSADNEILALRSSGVHFMRIFTPVIAVAVILSGIMIAGNYSTIPHLVNRATGILYQLQFKVLTSLQPGQFEELPRTSGFDMTLFFKEKDPVTNELKGINIKLVTDEQAEEGSAASTSDDKKHETIILAERGKIEADEESGTIKIRLMNGSLNPLTIGKPEEKEIAQDGRVEFGALDNDVFLFEEMEKVLQVDVRKRRGAYVRNAETMMSVRELLYAIEHAPRDKHYEYWTRRMKNELFRRFSTPLACIAVVLIGMPLGILVRPTSKMTSFIISFLLIFIYYGMLKWGISLGEHGSFLAGFAIFSPNLLLAVIGILLMRRALRI